MNISYDLWPIWCDYLEEQGQNTELLRYVLTYPYYIAGEIGFNTIFGSGSCHCNAYAGEGFGASFGYCSWINNPSEYGEPYDSYIKEYAMFYCGNGAKFYYF